MKKYFKNIISVGHDKNDFIKLVYETKLKEIIIYDGKIIHYMMGGNYG